MTWSKYMHNVSGAAVIRGEDVREVKNLGWLLRNWKNVVSMSVTHSIDPNDDAVLWARMADGARYRTGFADKTVLWSWLNRPVFEGLTINWFGKPYELSRKGWQDKRIYGDFNR